MKIKMIPSFKFHQEGDRAFVFVFFLDEIRFPFHLNAETFHA